jgi:DNA repair photolyase
MYLSLKKKRCFQLIMKKSKNTIILELASLNLVKIHLSITSLSEKTRQLLEPRTASIKNRLKTLEILSANKVPVYVMMASIISSLNSHEILPLVKKVAELGALDVGYTMVRLNGQVGNIFRDWIQKAIPDRADRILNQIAETHGGTLNESSYKTRMRGEGVIAQQVKQTMSLAKKKYLKNRSVWTLDKSHYLALKNPQMKLF